MKASFSQYSDVKLRGLLKEHFKSRYTPRRSLTRQTIPKQFSDEEQDEMYLEEAGQDEKDFYNY
jgi:hypothetical protein